MSIHTRNDRLDTRKFIGCTKMLDDIKDLAQDIFIEKKLIISYDDISVNTTISMNKYENNREEIKNQVIKGIRQSWVYSFSVLKGFKGDGERNDHKSYLNQLVHFSQNREYSDVKSYVIRKLCIFLLDYLEATLGLTINDILKNYERVSFTELAESKVYLTADYINYVIDNMIAQLRNESIVKKLRHSRQPAEITLRNGHVLIKTIGLLLLKDKHKGDKQ